MGFGLMLAIYILDGVIFGLITQYVSTKKGYESGFAWGFFFGLIGLLVVGFRPSIEQRTTDDTPIYGHTDDNLHISATIDMNEGIWLCGCGAKNKKEALFCKNCGNQRIVKSEWKCLSCGKQNEDDAKFCVFCGEGKKEQNIELNTTPQKTESDKAYKIQYCVEKNGKKQIKCSVCDKIQDSERNVCWKCGREFMGYQGEQAVTPFKTNERGWTCPKCKRANTGEHFSCVECGYQREI